MPERSGRRVVHVIEAQHLFVPALVDVFAEAGMSVDYVGTHIDPRRLLDDKPDLVFLDADFIDEPLQGVRLAHVLVPDARICVYTTSANSSQSRAYAAAGADLILDKSTERSDVIELLRKAN